MAQGERASTLPATSVESVWEVRWDGSFGAGAGIGITIARDDRLILKAAVPVFASDATRCEALGPALAALLLARLPWKFVRFKGDSHTVVRLLRQECRVDDIWLYNAIKIALDLLRGGHVEVTWIPRSENQVCDTLAREAV